MNCSIEDNRSAESDEGGLSGNMSTTIQYIQFDLFFLLYFPLEIETNASLCRQILYYYVSLLTSPNHPGCPKNNFLHTIHLTSVYIFAAAPCLCLLSLIPVHIHVVSMEVDLVDHYLPFRRILTRTISVVD